MESGLHKQTNSLYCLPPFLYRVIKEERLIRRLPALLSFDFSEQSRVHNRDSPHPSHFGYVVGHSIVQFTNSPQTSHSGYGVERGFDVYVVGRVFCIVQGYHEKSGAIP